MAIYFISDLHLQPSHPAMAEGFFQFLERLTDAEALYLLGDFFEFWVGDDYEDEFVNRVKAALRALSERGVALYFMHGNRDFMIGQAFCDAIGATLLQDPARLTLGDETALLLHGDSLCTQDVQYMKMRGYLRNPQWQSMMMAKPITERLALAQMLRGAGKEATQMKSADIMDVTPEEVDRVLSEHQVRTMIHGHTHRPHDHVWQHNDETRRRLVLGDWTDTQGWMIRWDDETGLVLSQFHF